MSLRLEGALEAARAAATTRAQEASAPVQLETFFLTELYRVMRQSVPQSTLMGGFAGELFGDMLDEALAKEAAGRMQLGLGDAVRRQVGEAPLPAHLHERLAREAWTSPVAAGPAARGGQLFGAARYGARPESCGEGHCGLDLARPVGQTVVAAASGVVTRVHDDPAGEAGRWVEVHHPNSDTYTRYMHLDRIDAGLRPGLELQGGDTLGTVGSSGSASSGAHLHVELMVVTPGGGRTWVDPSGWLHPERL